MILNIGYKPMYGKSLTKKKKKVIVYDDDPKVGQIWKRRWHGEDGWEYFVLVEREHARITNDPLDNFVFRMLNMNTGNTEMVFMNFELDEWRIVHET